MIWTYLTLGAPQKYSSIQARLQSHSEAADNIARPLMIRSHIFIYFFTLIIDLNNNNVNDCNVHLFVYIYNIYIGNDTRTVYTYQACFCSLYMYVPRAPKSHQTEAFITKQSGDSFFLGSTLGNLEVWPEIQRWGQNVGSSQIAEVCMFFFQCFVDGWECETTPLTSLVSQGLMSCHWFLKIQVVTERFMSQRYLHADLSMSICLYVSFLFYLEAFASCMYLLVL